MVNTQIGPKKHTNWKMGIEHKAGKLKSKVKTEHRKENTKGAPTNLITNIEVSVQM